MEEPLLLSKRQAAKSLSISLRTLDKLIATNQFQVRKIGRRVLIAKTTVEKFAHDDSHKASANGEKLLDTKRREDDEK